MSFSTYRLWESAENTKAEVVPWAEESSGGRDIERAYYVSGRGILRLQTWEEVPSEAGVAENFSRRQRAENRGRYVSFFRCKKFLLIALIDLDFGGG